MKIPFTLGAWLKDTSQKVVDKDGRPVRIICTDADGLYPIIGLVDNKTPLPCGKDGRPPYIGGGGGSLFFITPEPELSEFEERIFKLLRQYKECDIPLTPENIKAEASILWPDFEKYFFDLYGKEGEGDSALRSFYYRGLEDGKAEALRTNATELEKNLANSGLDKDSIPYHLIEFMCNLYTCPNWKEIEETAELYVTRIKAATLKDLPRWEDSQFEMDAQCVNYGWLHVGKKMIYILDLEKLPGFKED